MKTKWMMDPNQSDILIKMRHSIVAYMTGTQNKFDGYVEMKDNEIEAASVEFLINVNNNETILEPKKAHLKLNDLLDKKEYPIISFKSTSFEKINKNINFLKGNLTIRNITKVIELDAEYLGIKSYNGTEKAAFEITGDINRKDFGLDFTSFNQVGYLSSGNNIKLIANLEFTV
ncbi:YceI family protein [Flavobacterium sp.]|uniref:YceI family protein n=1 Tax=Flavobacterium sp. TaxID=239 RepID=UPI0025BC7723|nr:YceI family protein [Flavobacterium sp.]MBA4153612.1 polyisoprenoid-binding protein [Flavobacterium sp.]